MKHLLKYVPLILLIVACSPEPQTVVLRDRLGREMGSLQRVSGKKSGPVQLFHPDGTLRLVGSYDRDRKQGPWITFSEKGDTLSICDYLDGFPQGWKITRSAKGIMLRKEQFNEGVPDGPMFLFSEDGDSTEASNYTQGLLDGPIRRWSYDEHGKCDRTMTGRYDQGEQTGEWVYRYGDGSMRSTSTFVNGKLQGLVRKWKKDGSLEIEQEWDKGVLINTRVPE